MTQSSNAPPPETAAHHKPALEPVHDFVGKFRQPALLPRVQDYVEWRRAVVAARSSGTDAPAIPDWAPLSINLDLTTACNYACDHCIDWDTLNSGINYDDAALRTSLANMAERGLKSVILIGGGEPTVYPGFREMVAFLKGLGLQIAIVSNGSRNDRILDIIDLLDEHDWVRLSLDSGTDATFQAMHKPKKPVTLEEICEWIPRIKARNPRPRIGFSYIIVWEGAERGPDTPPIVENIDEIREAAQLAHDHQYDYISFKPFLTRAPDGAEIMDPDAARDELRKFVTRIRTNVDAAKALSSERFAVLESTNLKLLESESWKTWTDQPRTCHMQAFRQVLSPLGLWNCPAHRGVAKARIDERDAFGDDGTTTEKVSAMLDTFDASEECREVTCLYHETNWWIEQAIEDPRGLNGPVPDTKDYFL